jgi:hypothetical protein
MKVKQIPLVTFLLLSACSAYSQNDTTKKEIFFKGAVSVTNNGFSFIPTFTLGKPAAIIDISVIGRRFSFEPQFRFNLEDVQPWSFIFIWRYKFILREKFNVSAGAHLPAINFRLVDIQNNGVQSKQTVTQRFLPFEFMSTYFLSKNTSIGMYYLWGRALEDGYRPKQGHFLSLRANMSRISLSKKTFLRFNPQTYYLKQDHRDGIFVGGSLSLMRSPLPISLSGIVNKAVRTNIIVKDFDWNISLVYAFNNTLQKQ